MEGKTEEYCIQYKPDQCVQVLHTHHEYFLEAAGDGVSEGQGVILKELDAAVGTPSPQRSRICKEEEIYPVVIIATSINLHIDGGGCPMHC